MPGMGELLIILLIVLLIFGAGKLPAIGDALGRSIKNFRRSASGKDEIEVNDDIDVNKKQIDAKKRAALAEGDVEDADVIADKSTANKEA